MATTYTTTAYLKGIMNISSETHDTYLDQLRENAHSIINNRLKGYVSAPLAVSNDWYETAKMAEENLVIGEFWMKKGANYNISPETGLALVRRGDQLIKDIISYYSGPENTNDVGLPTLHKTFRSWEVNEGRSETFD